MWLRVENRGDVRWLTLDRPEVKNAVPPDGWQDLRVSFTDFERSQQRVLVVTGAGGDFCSGADLGLDAQREWDVASHHRRLKAVSAAAAALHRLTKPAIAAVDGVAAGAGMNLALGCDLVVCSDKARFSEIFVRRGLTLDFGGSWLLPRAVGRQRAMELALTGRMVGADEALRLGLCLEVVAPEDLESRVTELARALAAGAPLAQAFTKQALGRAWEVSFESALSWETQSQSICLSTEDVAEGLAAFRERREPRFRGV